MARGDKELHCLKRVLKDVFPAEGVPIVENADASLLYSSVFGFTQEDWETFCNVLASAEPNANPNEFPDYISADSVIEHFEISATKENGKGSTFRREHEPFLKSMQDAFETAVTSGESQSVRSAFCYPIQSHRLLLESLERNLEGHIESLQLYMASHEVATTVFLIEFKEHGLSMIEDVYGEIGEGRVFGDMREQQKYDSYRLSRDKDALALLYGHVNVVDIAIFVGVGFIEFIKLAEVPNMLKLMPWPFAIAAGPTIESHAYLHAVQVRETSKEQVDYE